MRKLRPYLYQGDTSDLNALPHDLDTTGRTVAQKYGITLAVNVGSTPFVPRGIPTVYFPMKDSDREGDNDWGRIASLRSLLADEVNRGGKLLIVCDAGLSRSVVLAGMVISDMEGRSMDSLLFYEISAAEPPLEGLWMNARRAMEATRR